MWWKGTYFSTIYAGSMDERYLQHPNWNAGLCFLLIVLSVSEQIKIDGQILDPGFQAKCGEDGEKLMNDLQMNLKNLDGNLFMQKLSSLSDECQALITTLMNQSMQIGSTEMPSLGIIKGDLLNELIKEADIDELKEMLKNKGDDFLQITAIIGEEIIKKSGGKEHVTVTDLEVYGSAAVYLIPPLDYRSLSADVFKKILSLVSEETQKALQYIQNPNMTVDFGAVSMAILNDDNARIKALCGRAFHLYKKARDINSVEGWKNIQFLLFCAPPSVCKSVDNDKVQSNIASLTYQPWTCGFEKQKSDSLDEEMDLLDGLSLAKNAKHLFPSNRLCGKILAEKLMTGGKTPYQIHTIDDITNLNFLSWCLPQNVLKEQIDKLGCAFASEAMKKGMLNQKLSNYAAKKCASPPDKIEDVTCQSLGTTYMPYLKSMKRSFFKSLPQQVMCDDLCLESFKEQLPEDMIKHIMRKCYKNTVITPDAVSKLGGLIMELPIDKFEEISAEDLGKNIQQIKKDLKSSFKEKGTRNAVKKLAKKLIAEGNVADLVDSSEIMKEVSLKDLKNSLATSVDVVHDLGIDSMNETLGMTDSQKKWVMKEVMKNKQPENFQVGDLQDMKSLVTGLLSSHIKKMGEAHSGDDGGMALAVEMCTHSDWPRKSLVAINKHLIQGSLQARNSTDPMSSLTVVDVQSLGCHCLLNFEAAKYVDMNPDVCSAMCMKIGYCDMFRCLNPVRRKNILQACLKCKGLGTQVITDTDFDELGPNLISQMSKNQLDMIPAQVLNSGIELFKDMCMDKTLRLAVSEALQEVIGSSGGDYTSETLYMLSSAIKLLPRSLQQQLDKNVLAEMQTALMEELAPKSEEGIKLKKCCEKWLDESDLENLDEQNFNLMLTVKDAMFSQSDISQRRKRAANIFIWTCRQLRSIPILFQTASSEEIQAMDEKEFLECLPDIGKLTQLKDWQKSLLLEKAKKALSVATVCNLELSDIENLGAIAPAFSVEEIGCLPLNEVSLVTSFGSFNGWSAAQLQALANRYIETNNITSLSWMTDSDISMLGPIMCGFTLEMISSLSPLELGKSGKDIGALKQCSIEHLKAFAEIAVHDEAYGTVETWDAAAVTELKYIIAGLSGPEISQLRANAIEGLHEQVIPFIPANVLKEITTTQLEAFTDQQIRALTNAQKKAMSTEQRIILGDIPPISELGYAEGHSNAGVALEKTFGSILTFFAIAVIVL